MAGRNPIRLRRTAKKPVLQPKRTYETTSIPMDYFAHGFWSYIFFHRIRQPIYAVIFGLLPDTMSWGIFTIYNLLSRRHLGRPALATIPHWAFILYGINHSVLVSLLVILIVYLIFRRVPIFIWAWPIAILMDIPTHTREFLPTPFLWPISDWHFPGISWASWKFMVVNYLLIAVSLTIIYLYRRHA